MRLQMDCPRHCSQPLSKSIESTETVSKRTTQGSFRASSISVESTANNSDEADYLREIQRLDDEGDKEFNENSVLASTESEQEDDDDINSEEFRKEITDLF